MTEQLERCCKCDEPTGRAGKGDDSLYRDDGTGSYCEGCLDGDDHVAGVGTMIRDMLKERHKTPWKWLWHSHDGGFAIIFDANHKHFVTLNTPGDAEAICHIVNTYADQQAKQSAFKRLVGAADAVQCMWPLQSDQGEFNKAIEELRDAMDAPDAVREEKK